MSISDRAAFIASMRAARPRGPSLDDIATAYDQGAMDATPDTPGPCLDTLEWAARWFDTLDTGDRAAFMLRGLVSGIRRGAGASAWPIRGGIIAAREAKS